MKSNKKNRGYINLKSWVYFVFSLLCMGFAILFRVKLMPEDTSIFGLNFIYIFASLIIIPLFMILTISNITAICKQNIKKILLLIPILSLIIFIASLIIMFLY